MSQAPLTVVPSSLLVCADGERQTFGEAAAGSGPCPWITARTGALSAPRTKPVPAASLEPWICQTSEHSLHPGWP